MIPARRTATAATVVLATAGGLLTTAATPASAAGCTSPTYTRQFFANTTLSGTPKRSDCDAGVDEYWSGSPATGVPADNFSVRWTVTRDFGSGGPFSLTVKGQDGMRVYLDGYRKIDLWKGTNTTVSKTANLTIPAGKHTLRVDYANWTGVAAVKFAYTPITSATYDKVRPLAPTGLAVSYDKVANKAQLTWARNKEMDLAGYRVYRRQAGTGTWVRMTTTTGTSYTDTTLPQTGSAYYYEVRALDKAGNESYGTADVPVTTVDRTAPAVPSGVAVRDGQPGVAVTWNAVSGAAHYLLYRRWENDGMSDPVEQVGKVAATSWIDSTAKENLYYSYWVAAVDAAGNRSALSPSAYVERGDFAPSAPTALTAAPRTGEGIVLSWSAPSVPVAQDLTSYRIYCDGRFLHEVPARQTSYLDTGVHGGTSYRYTVTAVDVMNQESAPSAPATATAPATGLAPEPVAGLRGRMNGTDIELIWQRNAEEDVDHYDVYRGVLVDGTWQYDKWGWVRQTWVDEPTLSFVRDLYEPQGETARWAVIAVDGAGNSRFTSGEEFSYVTVTEVENPA
ncbi:MULTISPECIES: fibronectin type III domain-containing protein [Streptomyces]|uniref:Cellulose 1,4-beta-cellobiosidase n=2 Tax=Streptomyces TaxID=1883 RepID=A0A2U9P425_STRAS|nr:fibronectin type III domain-containing protein [Streptomyces actuosus]AWT44490.1 cellulose 1,4-beta-cellobiosidase [Streptomyces actuosus]MBM4820317.1 cellulose 1,4-beta-cellobiosidase [Streptomyces actuosus]